MTDMTKQTEADRLANQLDYHREYDLGVTHTGIDEQAAAELRRQQAEIERLNEALASEAKEQPAPVAKPRKQEPVQRYSPDGEGGMEVDSLGAWMKFTSPPAQQEPVGKKTRIGLVTSAGWDSLPVGTEFYTSPQAQRTWVGLTEFDIDQIPYSCSHADSRLIAYAIEAKLKEKNGITKEQT